MQLLGGSDIDAFPLSQQPVGVNDALTLSAGREKKLQGHCSN